MQVYGYKKHNLGTVLAVFLSLVSFGIFPLVCYLYPKLYVYLTRVKSDLSNAELVGIYDDGAYSEADLITVVVDNKEMSYFEYKKQRFTIGNNTFVPLHAQLSGSCKEILGKASVTANEARESLSKYGYNTLDIEPKPLLDLVMAKVSHPFYIFQSLSVFIWIRTGTSYL